MTAIAPVVTLAEPCTLVETGNVTIATQKLLLDGESLSGGVVLHHHTARAGGFVFITVPAEHLLALDLDHCTITRLVAHDKGQSYSIVFKHTRHALAYLAKHYGLIPANDSAPTPTDASPCPSVVVDPAHLPTPPRQPRRPLSTAAFRPNGVIPMSKKQPIRVFLEQEIHSRYLIQAGTHGLTPSALGERLIQYGVSLLEDGDTAPLKAPGGDAPPAPTTTEA